MLGWALFFFIVALIAAMFGFGGVAGLSASIAKLILFVAVLLILLSVVAHALGYNGRLERHL